MEDPPFPTHPPHNPKRIFGGGSSSGGSTFVDHDVIEIPPPPTWKPKRLKNNSIVHQEVIDIDDEDIDDIMIIDEKYAPKSKGKKPMRNYRASKGTSSTEATIIDDDFGEIDLTSTSYDDDCVMLQAHFDNFDIPTGVEATVPWWPDPFGNQPPNSSSSVVPQQYDQYFKGPTPVADNFESQSSHTTKRGKHYGPKSGNYYNSQILKPGFPTNSTFLALPSGMFPPPPPWGLPQLSKHNGTSGSSAMFNPFAVEYLDEWTHPYHSIANPAMGHSTYSGIPSSFFPEFVPDCPNSIILDDGISAQISPPSTSGQQGGGENSILKRLETFKKFDTLEDLSDHLFNAAKESVKQSRSWSKTIAEEWRMLENDLPDTIFVRVYESRMDLLRAVILGADGTPYHDGLFFFDVHFTCAYPKSPPQVKYHAHGLRINPNLYQCGKVCLSLLGTWSGHGEENWRPGKSNMLQVLVSIQGLILNAEPYYNEPGYANSQNTPYGKTASKTYSENTFLLSLKTMLYTMRNPPKNFEDLVFGHFYNRAHGILEACRAYLDGVKVGSFEKGKTPAAAKTKIGTCSPTLKSSLPAYIKSLVEAFTKIGVKDCQKYLGPPENPVTNPGESNQANGRRRRL